jgi:cell wall-associated NlpC family hydrolase
MRAVMARMLDGTPLTTPAAALALRQHAIAEFPRECIGMIDAAGAYLPLTNHAAGDAAERHALADRRVVAQQMAIGNLRALCHSHPGGPDCPSETDMISQMEMEVPFVIVSTNGTATTEPFAWGDQLIDDEPLIGRPFQHGVTDCYAMIRAYYRTERGVLLPDFARNWEWWQDETPGEKDLYSRHFADAGFAQINRAAVLPGDVWLAAIRSEVPNHAGVLLDGGLSLHHPSSGLPHDPGRLSKRDPIARWTPHITHWLRRA